jgi:transcriptional regulator GlxA family with amidase domain
MSPLHYQNMLCLEEARSLLLSTMMDAGAALQPVGYKDTARFRNEN